jgi:tricorn protease
MRTTCLLLVLPAFVLAVPAAAEPVGYYRQPALHGDALVFVAEGDLWKVAAEGGVARRLTSHPSDESQPAISPDGRTVAFSGHYEGTGEVYTMPLAGGRPTRRTYGADGVAICGWTADGRVLYSTATHSTLPNSQLVALDVRRDEAAGLPELLPLAQAADGSYAEDGRTLFFTRQRFQGSHTKRYKGGTAQNIWRFGPADSEAVPLTASWPGTSKRPMVWRGRVYFASDRDGTMNLWSMDRDGSDLRQHTHHAGWDVTGPALDDGRIAYQLGADIHLYDIAADRDRTLPITLDSDLDQTRERWIDKPLDYVSSWHVSADGSRVVLTARGRVFVAPVKPGRLVEATHTSGVRWRDARFMPDGKTLVGLSDQSGEVELWQVASNGVGSPEQLTRDSDVLRWDTRPSPDGRWIAHHDKNQRLWLYDVRHKTNRMIAQGEVDGFSDLTWSPDGRFLAYVMRAPNFFSRIAIYAVENSTTTPVTSDRFDSWNPAFSPDGQWLYLLSDRNLTSIVGDPWGSYQPEPYLDRTTGIYAIALRPDLRSPFAPRDELHPEDADKDKEKGKDKEDKDKGKDDKKKEDNKEAKKDDKLVKVEIVFDGITERIQRTPVPWGNYQALAVNGDVLFWLQRDAGKDKNTLAAAAISRDPVEVKTVAEEVRGYEMSADGKKLVVRKENQLYVVEAKADKADLDDKKKVDLSGWALSIVPREEWRQMFVEAWRLERDYFYDPQMHGVDWPSMREKYRPLVDRVTTRTELSDLLAQMVSELSALHIFVAGGDVRIGPDDIEPASLGAELERDEQASGYRVRHVYHGDPDDVEVVSPLARPDVDVRESDVITAINGVPVLAAPDLGALLRRQAGRQVLLHVRRAQGGERDVIVRPLSLDDAEDLRYDEWETTRRQAVDRLSASRIGYVHLRAMGRGNYTEWARGYFPVFQRDGLIIDVRHNRGGNIDSWILGRLLRKAWFHWTQRVGQAPSWNMQYAFRGHMVVLCDERTASDGEAFAEGFRRLGLGQVIGTRTWGGEVWLSSNNFLADRGIATAAEFGVYGPQGEWIIEGHGVEPDVVVDNLPHATFEGQDAQLEAAVKLLQQKIAEQPIPPWPTPPYPNKSFRYPEPGNQTRER